ncbi:hypothetical protein MKW92_037861 [Papaver armeniacum]|nr:hypothetical protein MKW92_037861 [Papaver armeniacum]
MNQEHCNDAITKSSNYLAGKPQPSCPPTLTSGAVSVISPKYFSDVDGNPVFDIKDELTLVRHHRVLRDPAGVPIVTILEKVMTAHRRFNVFKGDSTDMKDLVFTARQSHCIQWTTKLDVFLQTTQKRMCVILRSKVTGWRDLMHKKHTVNSVVLGKDTFNVTVQPNHDSAFVIAVIIVLDAVNDLRAMR